MTREEELERIRGRLALDTPYYARAALKIVNKAGKLVPLVYNEPQLKVDRALEAQRAAGLPMRVKVLKSRRTGVSTSVQGKIIQRTQSIPHHKALVVAHDKGTSSEIFRMGELMYSQLPTDPELALKQPLRGTRKNNVLEWGERSADARRRGILGINSSLRVDTANEVETGRGFAYGSLHLSEVAFWGDAATKLTALLSTVANEEGTLIVLESTANGFNHWKTDCEVSMRGEDDYTFVFIGWLEDPDATRPFANEADRQEFEANVGAGPYGLDEPDLLEVGATLEQLYWRRWAIANLCRHDLDKFRQEYPSNPLEAFIGSGKTVFAPPLIARAKRVTDRTDQRAELGVFRIGGTRWRRGRVGRLEVPTSALWVPKAATGFGDQHAFWRLWERPDPGQSDRDDRRCDVCSGTAELDGKACPWCKGGLADARPRGAYVLAADPMSGEETEDGERAYHGVTIINHRTLEQVAGYESRIDSDLLALELALAAMFFNQALIAVEITGGYGNSIIGKVAHDFKYPRVFYRRQTEDTRHMKVIDRIGWDTTPKTKPAMEDRMRELLRTDTHGIRWAKIPLQMQTYIRDERGRTGPEANAFSDVLISAMIAQMVAREASIPKQRGAGPRRTSTRRARIHPRGGY